MGQTRYTKFMTFPLWQEHKHSKLKKYELCVMAGIAVNTIVNGETVQGLKRLDLPYADVERTVRRRQTQAFDRYLRAAQDYIENAVVSFPKRNP